MDDRQFDRWTLSLTERLSRRGLGGIAASLLASSLATTGDADAKKKRKRKKPPPSTSCPGCRDTTGRCVPVTAQSASACGRNNAPCGACANGERCGNGVCEPDLPPCDPDDFFSCYSGECINGFCCPYTAGSWVYPLTDGQVCGPRGQEHCCGPAGRCMGDEETCCYGTICGPARDKCCANGCTGTFGSYCA